MNSSAKDARGQGLTEYIIVVALVAIAAIGVITLFGDNIRSLFGVSPDARADEVDVKNRGGKPEQDAFDKKKLRNVGEQNSGP